MAKTGKKKAVAALNVSLSDGEAKKLAEQIVTRTGADQTQLMIGVGELVYVEVFQGDAALWQSKSPTKGQSLRKLAAQPGMADAKWGHDKLHEAVEIFLMSKALDLKAYPHLEPSHLALVANLDMGQQKKLLAQAEKGRWTVEHLGAAVGKKPGVAATPPVASVLGRVMKQVKGWGDPKAGLAAALTSSGIGAALSAPLLQAVADLGAAAQNLQQQLAAKQPKALRGIASKIVQLKSAGTKGKAARRMAR